MSENSADRIRLWIDKFSELEKLLGVLFLNEHKRTFYMLTDSDFQIVYASPVFEHLFGNIPSENNKVKLSSCISKDSWKHIRETLKRVKVGKSIQFNSVEILTKEKELIRSKVVIEPDGESGGNPVCYKFIINQRDDLIRELEHQKKIAEDANRAKTEFLANISHEIRTPMNAILGFTELLETEIEDPRHRTYLEAVMTSGKNLMMIINDILDLSKLESGQVEIEVSSVDLRTIIDDVVRIFSLQANQKNITIEKNIDEDLPKSLYLDEIHVRQILINLVGNAIKFTTKGIVRISVVYHIIPDDPFGSLILAIEDSGIGIPEDQQELIFESFRQQSGQSNRKYGGTGLGLAITKRLTERMNGIIDLESEPGKGSCFNIHLNSIVAGDEKAVVNQYMRDSIYEFTKGSVIIADDNALNIELLEIFLTKAGIHVTTANSGAEVLELLERAPVDLIMIDLKMPGMSGLETAKRIKENPKTNHIPVIVFTAAVFNDFDQSTESFFNALIQKPATRKKILEALTSFPAFEFEKKDPVDLIEKDNYEQTNWMEFSFSEEDSKIMRELAVRLNQAGKAMIINEIELIAEDLLKYGKLNNNSFMNYYGTKIMSEANLFDVEKITESLDNFDKIARSLIKNNE
jgi:signal transduction histidine kinase/DNA-binding NarL/FixJ family response regulator